MPTFLFDDIIFGPVNSRRLGVSLGINLMPTDKKYCNFDCLYCECGWTCNSKISSKDLPSASLVKKNLGEKLQQMSENGRLPDVITFAGNGEPTIHPEFAQIIDDTLEIRNKFSKKTEIAVLSNSLTLHKAKILSSLKKVDQAILKLDTAIQSTFELINRPVGKPNISKIIDTLSGFGEGLILQTLFFKGSYKNTIIDNSAEKELNALFAAYQEIRPDKIMIYTFDRDTPLQNLEKVTRKELECIGEKIAKLGISYEISA